MSEQKRWEFDRGMSDGIRGLEQAQRAAAELGWQDTADTLERLIEEADNAGQSARDEADEEEEEESCETCGGTGRIDTEDHIGDGTCPDC